MIEINNLTRKKVDEEKIKKIGEKILRLEKMRGGISIAFVGEKRIRKINKSYRKKDKATDILSFAQNKKFPLVSQEKMIGELIVCLAVVKKNALQDKISFEDELTRVLIHGILHLLGYNHEKGGREARRMKEKEDHYLSIIS